MKKHVLLGLIVICASGCAARRMNNQISRLTEGGKLVVRWTAHTPPPYTFAVIDVGPGKAPLETPTLKLATYSLIAIDSDYIETELIGGIDAQGCFNFGRGRSNGVWVDRNAAGNITLESMGYQRVRVATDCSEYKGTPAEPFFAAEVAALPMRPNVGAAQ